MNVQLIIDAIVRHTTVLIAQVATTSGVRSPLARVANQVFLDLVTELERQGLSKKVVADMFGLALRSYQQKIERLSESSSERGVSLWEAVHGYLKSQEVVSRAQVLQRFARDDEALVKSILRDLVETGLVYERGRGDACSYRIAPDSDLYAASATDEQSRLALAWVQIYRDGPLSAPQLAERLGCSAEQAESIVEALLVAGRILREAGEAEAEARYGAGQCLIPLGDAVGFEAALVDHFRAVTTALCVKLRNGTHRALPPDVVGGSTYSFHVWPGHPFERDALALLARVRGDVGAFWDRVADFNRNNARPGLGVQKVTFYCGQSVLLDAAADEASLGGDK